MSDYTPIPRHLIELDGEIIRRLRPAARRRDTTVPALVAQIIEIAVGENLVDAILDDR